MKKEIKTDKAPKAIGSYSQAIEKNEMIFVSGQLPIDIKTGEFAGNDITSQAKQSLENIKNILAEARADMNDIVKTTILLENIDHFAKANEVYEKYFEAPYPARATYEVSKLPKGALIEIEAIAIK